jgi:hypothetical protein
MRMYSHTVSIMNIRSCMSWGVKSSTPGPQMLSCWLPTHEWIAGPSRFSRWAKSLQNRKDEGNECARHRGGLYHMGRDMLFAWRLCGHRMRETSRGAISFGTWYAIRLATVRASNARDIEGTISHVTWYDIFVVPRWLLDARDIEAALPMGHSSGSSSRL